MRNASVAVVGAVALIAGWFGSSVAGTVGLGFSTEINNGESDVDKDKISDWMERHLCGTGLSAATIKQTQFGSCRTPKDWSTPNVEATFFIPTKHLLGPDLDRDGIPATIELTGYLFYTMPGPGSFMQVAPGGRLVVPLDQAPEGLDSDATIPNEVVVNPSIQKGDIYCISVSTGVKLGPDVDGDGFPVYAEVYKVGVQFDTKNVGIGCKPVTPIQGQRVIVDEDDDNADSPATTKIGPVSVPISAYHGGDADNDLVPTDVTIRWLDITIDRTRGAREPIRSEERESRHILDKDGSSNWPIPFDAFDSDLDGVPDKMEPWICKLQDTDSEADGKCVGADGKGADGSGSNYVPPVGRPNPWTMTTM